MKAVPVALALLLLAGCSSDFLVEDGGTAPVATPEPSVTADPTAEPTPDPESAFDCDDLLFDRPGNYVVGDCGTVTIEGSGIDLSFASIETLVIRGDRADLVGQGIGTVEIEGQGVEIAAASIGNVVIRGEGNTVVVDGRIGTVVVDGTENVVTAGDGVGSVIDNGLLNEIG